jgi:hypothetical protein
MPVLAGENFHFLYPGVWCPHFLSFTDTFILDLQFRCWGVYNGQMFTKDNTDDLKDASKDSKENLSIMVKDTALSLSYTRTNKLITALYMVTDIMDKNEPIRVRLRTLGTGIISDMHSHPLPVRGKIVEIMSFIEIALAMNIISEMNASILVKEFRELDKAVADAYSGEPQAISKDMDLTEFFARESDPFLDNMFHVNPSMSGKKGAINSKGHESSTRIGVQKGSTLMKALSDKILVVPQKKTSAQNKNNVSNTSNTSINNQHRFDILKRHRREELLKVIKLTEGSATIKDIKEQIKRTSNQNSPLISCGEKTLQRELLSMVRANMLTKIGEKRWSRYQLQ